MASPGHRDNILNASFDEIGVGIAGGTPSGAPARRRRDLHDGVRRRSATASGVGDPRLGLAPRPMPQPASAPRAKRVSAKKKAQISKRCHRVAKRTKGSKKPRTTRYDRCVSKALRAAAR